MNNIIFRSVIVSVMLNIISTVHAVFNFFDRESGFELLGTTSMVVYSRTVSPITGTLLRSPSAQISFQPLTFSGGVYSDGDFSIVLTATLDPNSTTSIQLLGNNSMSVIDPGIIREKVLISNAGNRIEGQPFFKSADGILFSGSSADLTMNLISGLNTKISLQSTVNLAADLELGDNVLISGPGTINFNNYNLVLGKKDLVWTDTLLMNNASNLVMNSANRLTGEWIFDGDARIQGNNFILDLTGGAVLRVRPNTTLSLSDVVIQGLGTGKILLDDCTSSIEILNVVTIKLDNDFTFTQGYFSIFGFLDLEGTATFGYQTTCTSEVYSLGTLYLGENMTFSYAPMSPNRDLIQFENSSAVVEMNGATLASTTTGMRITRGTLKANRHCYITQNQTAIPAISESIAIGNGNPSQEATVVIGPSAILEIISGRVFYDQNE